MTRNHQNDQAPKQTNKQTVSSIREAYRKLSSRESEVLHRLLEGKSNKKIADALHISEKTVENHITNIGKKLKLKGPGNVRKWLQNLAKKMIDG